MIKFHNKNNYYNLIVFQTLYFIVIYFVEISSQTVLHRSDNDPYNKVILCLLDLHTKMQSKQESEYLINCSIVCVYGGYCCNYDGWTGPGHRKLTITFPVTPQPNPTPPPLV